MKRKFKDGEKVYYKTLEKNGEILNCINEEDPKEVKTEGYRYTIKLTNGQEWSVPESQLLRNI